MPERIPSCPKCNDEMELGFIVTGLPSIRTNYMTSKWVAGEPVKSFWTQIKVEAPLEVTTYRCQNCGYLESYARAPMP
jgi:predicted nucleic-acid-binding Zn-ribbon protein